MRGVSFFNTDRFSMQWVDSWLGNGSELTNFVWDVHTARCVGVPPPSLAPYVGRRIRCAGPVARVMDVFGFQLDCAMLPGDGWSRAHDGWLCHVAADCLEMGVDLRLEVPGLFRAAMPDAAARRFDGILSRDRRGMVPDMCVALPAPGGGGAVAEVDCLAELKFIHFGPSQYPDAALRHPAPCRAVARRAERVHGEYVRKARARPAVRWDRPGRPPWSG